MSECCTCPRLDWWPDQGVFCLSSFVSNKQKKCYMRPFHLGQTLLCYYSWVRAGGYKDRSSVVLFPSLICTVMLFFHWQTRQEMVTASVRQAYCNSQPTTSQNGAESPEFSSIVPAVYSFNPPYCPLQLVVADSANIFLCCGNFNDYFLLCSL